MVKKILLIFFLIFARNSYCSQEESFELARLIGSIGSDSVYNVRNFLSSNQFDQKTLIEASKFAKQQIEAALKVGNKANVEKYKEIIKLLKAEPLKQKLRPYLTEDIVDLIVGYEQENVNQIEKEKLEKQIKKTLEKFIKEEADIDVNKISDLLDELEFLRKNEIINILKYMDASLKYADVDIRLTESGAIKPEPYIKRKDRYEGIVSTLENYSPPFKYIIESLMVQDRVKGFIFEYLIYKYLYLLLGEQTAIDNHILSPENLKKEMITSHLGKY